MRTQFGWVDGDSKFIMGDKEITKDGVFYSPPSSTTDFFAEKIHPKGDIEKWKEVFNLYAKPGMEPHAFAALAAFGAPLFKFTGLKGAIINVIYEQAGSGKSTILRMCNSVYGMPYEMMAIEKDTLNAKMQQLGVMNNLPNTIDEITNMLPKEFSDLAYGISQGRGKHRVKGSENALRVNNTSWQNMTLASANASFHEKLLILKSIADGESVRLLEYKIEPNDVIGMAYGKEMFDHQLNENYGHAGEIYLSYLVNNLESAKADYKMIQAKIDKEVQFTSRERFWSAVCATIITGGLIAKQLGLHDYDMGAIYRWMKKMLSEMRLDVKPPSESPVTALGEFVNAHLAMNTLVVNGEVDARTNMQTIPGMEPRGELLIRYEPDNKHLYVAAKQFKEFCVKQQINYKSLLKTLTDQQILLEAVNKRMSKGMKLSSPVVRTLKFDAGKSEHLQLDILTPDEDRDSVVSD
jgi:energy-coupling factor transporter ATP-binding protein EcfA2